MNKFTYYYFKYIELCVLPNMMVNEILYLKKNSLLDISFLKLFNKIKKIVNIRGINYQSIKYITNNILETKYNYKITSYKPIELSYVKDK